MFVVAIALGVVSLLGFALSSIVRASSGVDEKSADYVVVASFSVFAAASWYASAPLSSLF